MSSSLIWHAMPGLASGSNRSHWKKHAIINVLINRCKVYVHIAYLALRTLAVKHGKFVIFGV